MVDFYEVLGLPKSATAADVRAAYVRLAKEKHPDRFRDPTEKQKAEAFFKDLTTAFNTLFNPGTRAEYDRQHERPQPGNPAEIARDAHERALSLAREGGSAEEVLTLLRSAVHHQPEEGLYHAALGNYLARSTTASREAIQSLERAVQLQPRNAGFHADLALLFHKQGLTLRAQKAAEAALRLAPRDAKVQKVAGMVGVS
jgi:curved DNA-binding protein CbpA